MSVDPPFSLSEPSPIARLMQLRAGGIEAVVRDDDPTRVQELMAPWGPFEDKLWDALSTENQLRLLVLSGSAGSGKSATLNHLLKREADTKARRIGEHVADATHSDSPDQEQVERLAEFFAPFADGEPKPEGPCRVIAMNTGMALRFFYSLAQRGGSSKKLQGLESLLRRRLGLPVSQTTVDVPEWLDESVLVVNLDHRSTAGTEGDLFDGILASLDPANANGVLESALRCKSCRVVDWCWPMANASVMASPLGRKAINTVVGNVAIARGRHNAPRMLWDAAAALALGGLDPTALEGKDPCFQIAQVAEKGDEPLLIKSLACNRTLVDALTDGNPLVADIARRDPSYAPTLEAHKLIADAGLSLAEDASLLSRWLSRDGSAHPAVVRASTALVQGRAAERDGSRQWGRILARAAWLGGELALSDVGIPDVFGHALRAQAEGLDEFDDSASGRALEQALAVIEEGLANVFGLVDRNDHYYPTSVPKPTADADLLVKVNLIAEDLMHISPDQVLEDNPQGAELVGYQPLVLSISIADSIIRVDHPLWQLLHEASTGRKPSKLELERFLALRQAIRRVGVAAGADLKKPLLVVERGAGGARFIVTTRKTSGDLAIRAEKLSDG